MMLVIASSSVGQAKEPLDTFRIGNVTVRPGIEAHAQVLTTAEGNTGPFYHAHGLLHILPSLTINDAVSLRLRTVAEAWSFSSSYLGENNLHLWALPSIRARIVGGGFLDSITVLAGDLWRIKNGQGLALDYFEALGVNVAFHMGDFDVEATTAGYGWTGWDDIYMLNVRYDSLIRVNAFYNFGPLVSAQGEYILNRRIISIDVQLPIAGGLSTYGEFGFAFNHGIGALLGLKYIYKDSATNIQIQAEGRGYGRDFFATAFFGYPYINSITSLDKPVNTYRSWVGQDIGFYLRAQARQRIYDQFFLTTDTEYLSLNSALYTETCIGYAVTTGVDITVGYLNKLFNLYGVPVDPFNPSGASDHNSMFRVDGQGILKIAVRF